MLLEVTDQTWIITVVGYLVVFVALVTLIFVFSAVPIIISKVKAKKHNSSERSKKVITSKEVFDVSGEENAAIAMALHLFFDEMHEDESGVVTIKTVERRYSPWSSKIHSMNAYRRR